MKRIWQQAKPLTAFAILALTLSLTAIPLQAQTITILNAPSAGTKSNQGTSAFAINTAGTITGSYVNSINVSHGFVRSSAGVYTTFDPPSSTGTGGEAINTAGVIAGVYQDSTTALHGFVRTAKGAFTAFNPPGLGPNGLLITGINTAGAVTGWFFDSSNVHHGFVRAAPWTVTATGGDSGHATIRLGFDATSIDPALWRHQAAAEIAISLSAALSVALVTENRGTPALALTQALHTYLAIAGIERTSIEGLDGRPYIDQLAPGTRPVQAGPIRIESEVDRIYQASPDTVTVIDRANARRITVAKSGSLSTVVWNPWIEKSARLGDMGDDGYRRMLCIETANAGGDVVTLAPGARHRLVTQIAVKTI